MNRCVCKNVNGTRCKNYDFEYESKQTYKCRTHHKGLKDSGLVYVLGDGDKFYVGFTKNVNSRTNNHSNRWVKNHNLEGKVLSIEDNNCKDYEYCKTLQLMRKHGAENVRGSSWSYAGPLKFKDKDQISFAFIGGDGACFYCGNDKIHKCPYQYVDSKTQAGMRISKYFKKTK